MSEDPRTEIAERIRLRLMVELGERVDVPLLLRDERYARDILLACEALPRHGLPELARQFRAATRAAARERPPPRAWVLPPPDGRRSAWPPPSTLFGDTTTGSESAAPGEPATTGLDGDRSSSPDRGPLHRVAPLDRLREAVRRWWR